MMKQAGMVPARVFISSSGFAQDVMADKHNKAKDRLRSSATDQESKVKSRVGFPTVTSRKTNHSLHPLYHNGDTTHHIPSLLPFLSFIVIIVIIIMPCSSLLSSGVGQEQAEEDAPPHDCVREFPAKLDGYTCLAGPSIDKVLPVQFGTGDLAWVLKSKGRKMRGTAPATPNDDEEDANKAQRYELFLRGRIIDNPHASATSSSSTTTTIDKDDKDHATTTTTTTSADKDNDDRLWIQYPKGSTYHVKRKNLVRILQRCRGGLILVWPETDVYRRGCLTHTLPVGEGFVEIGCDRGLTVDRVARSLTTTTTTTPASSFPAVLGMDKADDSIASARRRYPHYTFVQWDCLQPDAVVPPELHELIQANESFHMAIDIGGNRDLPAVLQCLHRLLVDFGLQPRLVFVKSRALFQELQSQKG